MALTEQYPNIAAELTAIGAEFIAEYRAILHERSLSQSDELPGSMQAEIIEDDHALNLAIVLAGYWYFVERGRGPGKQPPLQNIADWVERTGIAALANTDGKNISVRSLAFLIARKIGREGTAGKHIVNDIIANNYERWIIRIQGAAARDVQSSVNRLIKKLTK